MSNGSASGHKRAKIRSGVQKYITVKGVRVPIGNAALTVSADPLARSADATLKVPIKRSTLTVRGSADPDKKSVSAKLKVPLPQRGVKKSKPQKKKGT